MVHGLSPLKIEVKGDMSSVRQACRVMACVARQTPKTYPRGMPPSYAKTLALESLQKDCPPAYEELMKKEKLTTSSAMRDRAPTEHACSAQTSESHAPFALVIW